VKYIRAITPAWRLVVGALVLVSVVSVMGNAPVAEARGGTYTPASISLTSTDPHLGDSVSFATTGGKRINVTCYQGGITQVVWSADQAVGTSFLLGGTSSAWATIGGSADCVAWLYNRSLSRDVVAQTAFTAQGAR
jgi:hypothetical protein